MYFPTVLDFFGDETTLLLSYIAETKVSLRVTWTVRTRPRRCMFVQNCYQNAFYNRDFLRRIPCRQIACTHTTSSLLTEGEFLFVSPGVWRLSSGEANSSKTSTSTRDILQWGLFKPLFQRHTDGHFRKFFLLSAFCTATSVRSPYASVRDTINRCLLHTS